MFSKITITSLLICFIPLVTVYLCFLLVDKKFSWWRGLVACICGLVAVAPIAAMQFLVDHQTFIQINSLSALLLSALVLNGLIEETFKMGLMFCVPAKNVEQREFLLYGILSGLTLACFETLVYLISGYDSIGLRLLTAVVIHVCCSGLSSLMVYSCKHNKKAYVWPYIIAVFLHGIYNYFAGFNNWLRYFSIAVILVAIVEVGIRYRKLKDPEAVN